ncbi:MAG: hypothetical protein QHJ82_16295 [Verrucomicrobiota bacterium]|nr:hypothetical protein [Verrucomicrobiota bacterium]
MSIRNMDIELFQPESLQGVLRSRLPQPAIFRLEPGVAPLGCGKGFDLVERTSEGLMCSVQNVFGSLADTRQFQEQATRAWCARYRTFLVLAMDRRWHCVPVQSRGRMTRVFSMGRAVFLQR